MDLSVTGRLASPAQNPLILGSTDDTNQPSFRAVRSTADSFLSTQREKSEDSFADKALEKLASIGGWYERNKPESDSREDYALNSLSGGISITTEHMQKASSGKVPAGAGVKTLKVAGSVLDAATGFLEVCSGIKKDRDENNESYSNTMKAICSSVLQISVGSCVAGAVVGALSLPVAGAVVVGGAAVLAAGVLTRALLRVLRVKNTKK